MTTINTTDQASTEKYPQPTVLLSEYQRFNDMSKRQAYFYLLNIDEYPEYLPTIFDNLKHALALPQSEKYDTQKRLMLSSLETGHWHELENEIKQCSAAHLFTAIKQSKAQNVYASRQLIPTLMVSGCWLQNLSGVATAHTQVGAKLTEIFKLYTELFLSSTCNGDFLRAPDSIDSVGTHDFSENKDFDNYAFELPALLLSIARYPRAFLPELIGLNFFWSILGINDLLYIGTDHLSVPENTEASKRVKHQLEIIKKIKLLSCDVAIKYLDQQLADQRIQTWGRMLRGVNLTIEHWQKWQDGFDRNHPAETPDPGLKVMEILSEKAIHGCGYHRDKSLKNRKIDHCLDMSRGTIKQCLDELAESRYISKGKPDNSLLISKITQNGGAMTGVFTGSELTSIKNWIKHLPEKRDPDQNQIEKKPHVSTRAGSIPHTAKRDLLSLSRKKLNHDNFSVRELFHQLVNVEYYPCAIPIAEKFVRDSIVKSRSHLFDGDRPIPDKHYQYDVLCSWALDKHRKQVDSYQPLTGKPKITEDLLIYSSFQLAPLLLIDGSWLQGFTNTQSVYSKTGQQLFNILYDETGGGDARGHHANMYRDLLKQMDIELPPVDSREFIDIADLQESSFYPAVLWLSISMFPRHYLPEILGLNLAVELAGIGGPYMEAHDALAYYGYSTAFVDIHNSADNIATGHSGIALRAINTYMNQEIKLNGQANIDTLWWRIWTGIRMTLPDSTLSDWDPFRKPGHSVAEQEAHLLKGVFDWPA